MLYVIATVHSSKANQSDKHKSKISQFIVNDEKFAR